MSSLSEYFGLLGRTFITMQLHAMRRRLPRAHRAWVPSDLHRQGIRPETDREYLARLRRLADERPERRSGGLAASNKVQHRFQS